MTDAAVTARVTPKPSRKASRTRHAKRQKAYRDRRKQRFREVLAMLEKIGDDDVIEIVGRKK